MSSSTARCAGGRHAGKRRLGRTVGVMASLALWLAVAAPAWATAGATATLAPIGSGSYLLTVTNTGSETIPGFVVIPIDFIVTDAVPSPACQLENSLVRSIACRTPVAPGASTQVCYTGQVLGESPGATGLIDSSGNVIILVSPSPAVASCPLPGFTPGSGSTSGTTIAPVSISTPRSSLTPAPSTRVTSSKGAHSWSHVRCKSAYKLWTKKHHHATRSQKKAEASKLHKTHGCPLSTLK